MSEIPSPEERAANHRSIMKMKRANRFRLMFGQPLLKEETTSNTSENKPMSEAQTSAEMPKYKCHKVVHALKIADVEEVGRRAPNGELVETVKELSFVEAGYAPIRVDGRWYDKHRPEAGGYYVVYADGYKSYSPAKAFEEGYSPA